MLRPPSTSGGVLLDFVPLFAASSAAAFGLFCAYFLGMCLFIRYLCTWKRLSSKEGSDSYVVVSKTDCRLPLGLSLTEFGLIHAASIAMSYLPTPHDQD